MHTDCWASALEKSTYLVHFMAAEQTIILGEEGVVCYCLQKVFVVWDLMPTENLRVNSGSVRGCDVTLAGNIVPV